MSGTHRLTAEERRDSIIEAALPLFARWGEAVTTKDIAEAAGTSEALIYRHFPGKAALYTAIRDKCVQEKLETLDFLQDLPNDTPSLVACTYILIRQLLLGGDEPSRDTLLMRLQLHSVLGDGEFAASFQEVLGDPWAEKIRLCMEAADAAGDLVEHSLDAELAFGLGYNVAWAHTVLNLAKTDGTQKDKADILDPMCRFVLRGAGMKDRAIHEYFNPEIFEMLLRNR